MLEKSIITIEKPEIHLEDLLRAVHMDDQSDPEDLALITQMLQEALAVSKPKAIFGPAQIESRDADGVTVEGVRFHSSLVSKNLQQTSRIIPFAVTCGMEAEEWSYSYQNDPLTQFWADAIKLQLLGQIRKSLQEEVRRRYYSEGDISAMSPGSLPAWPLTEQRPLFALLGGVTPDIGAYLTESCLILPAKSGSGFFFSSGQHYENCRYCPLLKCPNRRAEFEHELQGV
ncbi:MAG: vitamin B12 dependent methionine synthase [Candidatus Merdivicinus sp.]